MKTGSRHSGCTVICPKKRFLSTVRLTVTQPWDMAATSTDVFLACINRRITFGTREVRSYAAVHSSDAS